ncbi:hypothetical protein [Cellulomonas sp. PSBB021]|uniref:hypothetical protein n=1 Tax=Cellulomonas sp. PSBB021 TaxID=2003551 RepID=UPI000B8D9545|nr:hypothetical protein [Cellulomonas sp. PSBB021]ASR54088.1 hypothetical protein CBP52_01800 [Cellulomonas sp. PSBB021]
MARGALWVVGGLLVTVWLGRDVDLLATVLTGLAVARDQPILRTSPTVGVIGDRLRENVPTGPWRAPLFVGHGTADSIVPYRLTREYVPLACAAGATLELRSYEGASHLDVLQPPSGLPHDLVAWTSARLAGEDAPTSC